MISFIFFFPETFIIFGNALKDVSLFSKENYAVR